MKFSVPRRVLIAFAASVFLHLTLFGLLAIVSGSVEPQEVEAEEDKTPGILEIVLETPPPTPTPEPPLPVEETPPVATVEAALPTVIEEPMAATVIRTQLDPGGLQESEEAPEEYQMIASQHSKKGAGTLQPATEPGTGTEPEIPAGDDSGEEPGSLATIGEWRVALANRITQRWELLRKEGAEQMTVGEVVLAFTLDGVGKVTNIRIVSNTANDEAAKFAIRAILEADIPPIPADRIARTSDGLLNVKFNFLTYSTQ